MANKYKFNYNLLSASNSKDIEIAKNEWFIICKHTRDLTDGHCICGHMVKHVNYMFNIHNNKTIIVGSECYKKFNMTNKELSNKIMKLILTKILIKGEYKLIDDIDEYSNLIKQELINYYKDKINYSKNIDELLKLKQEINDLMKEYNIIYLNSILDEIDNRIYDINKKINYLGVSLPVLNGNKLIYGDQQKYCIECCKQKYKPIIYKNKYYALCVICLKNNKYRQISDLIDKELIDKETKCLIPIIFKYSREPYFPCYGCKCMFYSPIYNNNKYYALCKKCFDNKNEYKKMLGFNNLSNCKYEKSHLEYWEKINEKRKLLNEKRKIREQEILIEQKLLNEKNKELQRIIGHNKESHQIIKNKIKQEFKNIEQLKENESFMIEYNKKIEQDFKDIEIKKIEYEKIKEIEFKENELKKIEIQKIKEQVLLNKSYDIELINKCNNCNNKLTNILSIDLVLKHKERYNSLCKNCYRDYCISLQ